MKPVRASRSRLPPGGASMVRTTASKPASTASAISARVNRGVAEGIELATSAGRPGRPRRRRLGVVLARVDRHITVPTAAAALGHRRLALRVRRPLVGDRGDEGAAPGPACRAPRRRSRAPRPLASNRGRSRHRCQAVTLSRRVACVAGAAREVAARTGRELALGLSLYIEDVRPSPPASPGSSVSSAGGVAPPRQYRLREDFLNCATFTWRTSTSRWVNRAYG